MLETLVFALVLNLIGFVFAFSFKTDKLTDISYAATFMGIAIFGIARNETNAYKWCAAILVFAWAFRLGSYLLYRIHFLGRDKRFDEMRGNFLKFLRFWLLQAVTAWVVMLPASYVLAGTGDGATTLFVIGFAVALGGLVFEAVADMQKFAFMRDPARKHTWIDSGLWRYSRHPNYVGEITFWMGVYCASFSFMSGTERLVGLASPLLITLLLVFVSGVPLLEKSADKRWGKDKAYQAYKRRTPVLIPFIK